MGDLFMVLIDRKRLARLMLIQGVSQRQLAKAAGWESHTYLGRLLKGEVTTLAAEPALRIAHHLHVGVDDLFLTKVERGTRQHDSHHATRRTA